MQAATLAGRRVCFIAGTLGQGGAERQLYHMLDALRGHDGRPRVLCLTQHEFWEARIRALDVPVRYVGRSGSRLQRLARVVADLRADPADVVQSQHFYVNLYGSAAGRILGVPDIGAMRGDVMREVAGLPAPLGMASLRAPRLLAANSTRAIEAAATFGVPRARLWLLPNAVDVPQFTTPPRIGERPIRLLLAGRLSSEKRGDRFLRVLAGARQTLGDAVVGDVVGDGPERASLERQASALGLLPGAVEFHGAQADLAPWYRRASLLVLTSDSEGTPNVVLEAMAASLPVVATHVGDVARLVTHGATGFVVPRGDEPALIAGVLALAADGALRRRFGESGRRVIEVGYALPQLADRLRHLYAAALTPVGTVPPMPQPLGAFDGPTL